MLYEQNKKFSTQTLMWTLLIQMGIITESWGEFTAWHFYDSSVPNNVYRAVISFAQHAIKKKSSTKKIWISETVFKATIQGSFRWFSSTEQMCSDFIAEKKQKNCTKKMSDFISLSDRDFDARTCTVAWSSSWFRILLYLETFCSMKKQTRF